MSVDADASVATEVAADIADDHSFVGLVDREHSGIVAAVALIVGDRVMAEDIAQDSLERAYARWQRVGRLDRPGAWVRRVAINRAISLTRQRVSERRAIDRMKSVGAGVMTDPASVSGRGAGFDGSAAQLWSVVRGLPPSQATAVALHYGADLSLESVAVEMGTTLSSVKSLLHRARTTLRNDETIKEFEESGQ